MRSNRMFWAVLLILMGALFLGNNLGLFSFNVWSLFWPIFLILMGVWFLLGTMRGPQAITAVEDSIALDGASRAKVVVKHGAGRLRVDGSAAEGMLVSGTFVNGLDARLTKLDDSLDVIMKPQSPIFPDVILPWNWVSGQGLSWDFGFAREVQLDLTFETGAGEGRLDLEELQVRRLALKTGASSTDLTLPARAGQTDVKVEAGAASVKIRVPENAALQLETESGLASINVDLNRFPRGGNGYQSPGYETAENRIFVRIETGLGSIEIV